MDAILDTSVIIEIFKGNKDILGKLPRNYVYWVSVITLFELYCGKLKEKEEVFLEKIPKLEFNSESAKIAGRIFRELRKEGRIPKIKDLLIASSAIAKDKVLITADKDFKIFEKFGLKLNIVT